MAARHSVATYDVLGLEVIFRMQMHMFVTPMGYLERINRPFFTYFKMFFNEILLFSFSLCQSHSRTVFYDTNIPAPLQS